MKSLKNKVFHRSISNHGIIYKEGCYLYIHTHNAHMGVCVCVFREETHPPFKELLTQIFERCLMLTSLFKVSMDPFGCEMLELSMIYTGRGVICASEDTCCWTGLLYTVYNVYFFYAYLF